MERYLTLVDRTPYAQKIARRLCHCDQFSQQVLSVADTNFNILIKLKDETQDFMSSLPY